MTIPQKPPMTPGAKLPRGIATVEALRLHCDIDPETHCWLWNGALSTDGVPRIHTFDHERGEKRLMSGPKAAWNISRGEAPPSWAPLVYRTCMRSRCLCPVHLKTARDKAEICAHVSRMGIRKGTNLEQRTAARLKGLAAQGLVPTSPEIVLAIRAADPAIRTRSLARLHGVSDSVASAIRTGKTHRHLLPGVAA